VVGLAQRRREVGVAAARVPPVMDGERAEASEAPDVAGGQEPAPDRGTLARFTVAAALDRGARLRLPKACAHLVDHAQRLPDRASRLTQYATLAQGIIAASTDDQMGGVCG
jgi:hypothetical protein